MADDDKVVLRNVDKRFGETMALDAIDLDCRAGELLVLLGHSGAGKTTLLRLISGLERPDNGQVTIDGAFVNDTSPSHRGVAMAFESYALYPQLTVFENIAFYFNAPVRAKTFSSDDIRARVNEMADLLEIRNLLDRLPRQLSGGQRQRVALGRTLVRDAVVHLLDEPIAHLDARLRHKLRGGLKRFQRIRGRTTIWSTPDQMEAMSTADRIAVMKGGKIEQCGTPSEIYDRPANTYVAQSLGEPKMNIFQADIGQGTDGWHYRFADRKMPIAADPETMESLNESNGTRTITVGIRPSDIRLGSSNVQNGALLGRVLIVEPLGQHVIITLQVGNAEWKIKSVLDEHVELGEQVAVLPDAARYHFFDSSTESSLRLRLN